MLNSKKFDIAEFHKMFNDNILILYKGTFDKNILAVFSNYIEGIIKRYPAISKKIYSIFIELAQNIAYYSAEFDTIDGKQVGIGTLAIGEGANEYTFFTGNAIKNENLTKVVNKCKIINSMDKEALRKYRREQLNLPPGDHDTAHIGLIQVALTASNNLDVEITPFDNGFSFFSLKITVLK